MGQKKSFRQASNGVYDGSSAVLPEVSIWPGRVGTPRCLFRAFPNDFQRQSGRCPGIRELHFVGADR
jgi:hypothetical protein